MRGVTGTLALALVGLLAGGCASFVPVHSVLESMDEDDVDVVIDKVLTRYPNVGRLLASETFMIVLDSAIVARPDAPWAEDDARLVGAIASYMLGEGLGRDWVARVRGERAVIGEGQVSLLVYRDADGRRYLLDAPGVFVLFLPLPVAAGGRSGAIESISFDLKVSNQSLRIPQGGGAVDLHAEIIPREGVYTSGGLVFKRWSNALFHLGWDRRAAGGNGGDAAPGSAAGGPGTATAAASPRGRDARLQAFLENTRAYIGPIVRIQVTFEQVEGGFFRISTGVANTIELVLPNALIAGDRALEVALDALSAALPGQIRRQRDDIYIRVGYFFFHPHPTGPASEVQPGPGAKAEALDLKRFRIPAPPR